MRVKNSLLMILLTLFALPAHAQGLRVLAATNLQKVMTDAIVPAFKKSSGATVTPTFGSTKLLATQLSNGAPCDVFVSADSKTVATLAMQKMLDGTTARVYAVGSLVLWTRKDALLHPRRLADLADARYAKIAIANPALAPYGLAAQQAFAASGLTASITPRLVQAENIGQALQYAQSGNAEVCLTALSLVIGDPSGTYVVVPDTLHAPITQSVAVATGTMQRALALRFVDFLTSSQCAPLWKRYGYELPARAGK